MRFILVLKVVNRIECAGCPTEESDYLHTRRFLLAGS